MSEAELAARDEAFAGRVSAFRRDEGKKRAAAAQVGGWAFAACKHRGRQCHSGLTARRSHVALPQDVPRAAAAGAGGRRTRSRHSSARAVRPGEAACAAGCAPALHSRTYVSVVQGCAQI